MGRPVGRPGGTGAIRVRPAGCWGRAWRSDTRPVETVRERPVVHCHGVSGVRARTRTPGASCRLPRHRNCPSCPRSSGGAVRRGGRIRECGLLRARHPSAIRRVKSPAHHVTERPVSGGPRGCWAAVRQAATPREPGADGGSTCSRRPGHLQHRGYRASRTARTSGVHDGPTSGRRRGVAAATDGGEAGQCSRPERHAWTAPRSPSGFQLPLPPPRSIRRQPVHRHHGSPTAHRGPAANAATCTRACIEAYSSSCLQQAGPVCEMPPTGEPGGISRSHVRRSPPACGRRVPRGRSSWCGPVGVRPWPPRIRSRC